ncbi:hypothetical protein [Streptomyces sp. ID05-47C]|uniref:hypothetical protein n=1 Tax=Streptomyces sp. ID05-47C TaxID=3028665 RepID=UPI0029BA8E0A|nr:hypothetical protein [Streptomyces sp. ID05-47C]MDX3573484.1 hypothetical protein [Streptomyces sp. ID05-47C]
MPPVNAIEFFHYPWAESPTYPDYLVWGIRVDGTDLRALVGEVTYPLWRAELAGEFDDEAEDEKETAEQVRTQHDGLGVPEFEDHHFRTQGDAVPLLGCSCGIWGCWPLMAKVTVTPTAVTWSAFRQPYREEEWGELALGPYEFPRDAYEATLAAPPVLREDPLPLP